MTTHSILRKTRDLLNFKFTEEPKWIDCNDNLGLKIGRDKYRYFSFFKKDECYMVIYPNDHSLKIEIPNTIDIDIDTNLIVNIDDYNDIEITLTISRNVTDNIIVSRINDILDRHDIDNIEIKDISLIYDKIIDMIKSNQYNIKNFL